MAYFLFYPYTDETTHSTLSALSSAVGHAVDATAPANAAAIGAILSGGQWFQDLSLMTDNDTLVVVGHGAEGGKVMGSNDPKLPKDKSHIDQSIIISRMKDIGLTKSKRFDILIYSCYSGTGERPLAGRVARELGNQSFLCHSNIYGCLGKAGVKAKNNKLTVQVKGHLVEQTGDVWKEMVWQPIQTDLSKFPTTKAAAK